MDSTSSRLAEIRDILEEELCCDLTDVTLEPSLTLGHDGLGLDSLMIMDLLARLESTYLLETDPATLMGDASGVTIRDLLRMTGDTQRR